MAWEAVTLGECRLIHGDALEVLPTLPSASVQLILVDPPYGGVKTSYQGEKVLWDRQWPTREAYLAWLRQMAKEWQRVLTANGSLYCFAAPQMAAWVEVTLSETFNIIQRITWRKPPFSTKAEMFDKESCRMFFPASEAILFAEQYSPQYEDASRALHMQTFAPMGRYIAEERIRAGATRDEVDVALGFVRTKDPSRGTELCRRWEEGSSLPTRETYERLRTYLNSHKGTTDYLRREYADLRREYEEIILGESGFQRAERGLKISLFAQPILEAMQGTQTTAKQVTEAIGAYGTVNHGGAVSNWLQGYNIPTQQQYEAMRTFFNTSNGHTDYLRREYEDLRRPFTVSPQVPYTDVWDFATVPAAPGKHPAEKPLPLLRHIITVSSRPGDVVLDSCAGSFSTLEAARQCGRKGIGIEQERHWWTYGQRRLSQETLFAQLPMSQKAAPAPVQANLFAKGDTA
jgi:site-specific DNA-methyltransferase (adenine-specific)